MAVTATAGFTFPSEAGAEPIAAMTFDQDTILGAGNYPFTLGWAFSVNDTIRVTDLSYYAPDQHSSKGSHAVGFWTIDGTLLASGVVALDDPRDGDFRYTDIPDIILAPGDYVVGGVSDLYDGYVWVDTFTTPAEITFLEGRDNYGSALTFPWNFPYPNPGAYAFLGGSFRFETVPEPGTLSLLGFGLAGLGLMARQRRTH